jgi:RNA polymerase sigma-70 factor (ECF subfamily)
VPVSVEEHLFRRESGRLVATLTRVFGVQNLHLAQDVAQHAFCRALELWKVQGVPENPSAWLLATARHRALDVLRRERTAHVFAPELSRLLESEAELSGAVEQAFQPAAMRDEQLRMMFSCCHPGLPAPAQLALVLNILCGFGAHEIAGALLTGRAAIEKRIVRGKRLLAGKRTLFDLSDAELPERLATVQRALYLLFNEGYHGASRSHTVRPELCEEALRLTGLLADYPLTASPSTLALAALLSLNAARLPARVNEAGDLCALGEQDRRRWDRPLLQQGLSLFERARSGSELSAYHVEAAIAVAHVSAASFESTQWALIVQLYDRLMSVAPSPVVALNRAVAIAERDGPERGLSELRAIAGVKRLEGYLFYPAALGELELRLGHHAAAREHFAAALKLCNSDAERRFLQKRLTACAH